MNEIDVVRDMNRLRKEATIRQVLYTLRQTTRLTGVNSDFDDVRVEFTDKSVEVIAPLVEALDILEAIIWASDGCMGHRNCTHSMEPWQRARALLQQKWDDYERRLLG